MPYHQIGEDRIQTFKVSADEFLYAKDDEWCYSAMAKELGEEGTKAWQDAVSSGQPINEGDDHPAHVEAAMRLEGWYWAHSLDPDPVGCQISNAFGPYETEDAILKELEEEEEEYDV